MSEGATTPDAAAILALVRSEATAFGRCCDLYQDGFGTFADVECAQKTFAMLRGVQGVLGVNKAGHALSPAEVDDARKAARLRMAAPDLLAALVGLITFDSSAYDKRSSRARGLLDAKNTARAAIARAEGRS